MTDPIDATTALEYSYDAAGGPRPAQRADVLPGMDVRGLLNHILGGRSRTPSTLLFYSDGLVEAWDLPCSQSEHIDRCTPVSAPRTHRSKG